MKKKGLIIILVLLVAAACKRKAEPLDEIGAPLFYAKGYINDAPVNLQAGEEQYYLQTAFSNDENVQQYTGTFRQACASCNTSLQVTIRNYREGTGAAFFTDSSLGSGRYDYKHTGYANIPRYIMKLESASSGSGTLTSHLWDFGNGNTYTSGQVTTQLRSGQVQPVSYTSTFANGCTSSLFYRFRLNPYRPMQLPDFTFEKMDSAGIIYRFNATGDSAATYFWDFGDGKLLKGKTVYYGFKGNSVYPVTLRAVTGADTAETAKNIGAGPDPRCTANFRCELTPVVDPLNLSTVVVHWVNEAGETFSSANVGQDLQSNFTVLSSSPFITNAAGQKTSAVELLISCKLAAGNKIIHVKDLRVKFAVAHP